MPAPAETIEGRPAQIASGTRLLLIGSDGHRYRVRLAGIGEPAAAGAASRRQLQMLVAGKPVRLSVLRREHGGNLTGRLFHGGVDIGLRMLRAGLVHYRAGDLGGAAASEYRAAEADARQRRVGIWSPSRR